MNHILFIVIMTAALLFGPELGVEQAQLVDLTRTNLVEWNYNVSKTIKEEKCLTEAIYYEAGNQSEIGKEAVALVILNRVGQKHRPKTICGVIAQAHVIEDRKICQFSFFCETKRKPMKETWNQSQQVAHRVLTNYWNRDIISQYQDAVYYHARYVHPKWAKHKVRVGMIEDHIFYKEPQ
jgi:spore germination cell wall hydrolase CwlJ-like protein